MRENNICDILAFHFLCDGMHVKVQGLLFQSSNVINSGGMHVELQGLLFQSSNVVNSGDFLLF
jgi:hypothetical protein